MSQTTATNNRPRPDCVDILSKEESMKNKFEQHGIGWRDRYCAFLKTLLLITATWLAYQSLDIVLSVDALPKMCIGTTKIAVVFAYYRVIIAPRRQNWREVIAYIAYLSLAAYYMSVGLETIKRLQEDVWVAKYGHSGLFDPEAIAALVKPPKRSRPRWGYA